MDGGILHIREIISRQLLGGAAKTQCQVDGICWAASSRTSRPFESFTRLRRQHHFSDESPHVHPLTWDANNKAYFIIR